MDLKDKLRIFNAKIIIFSHRLEKFGAGIELEEFGLVLDAHIEIMKQTLLTQEEVFRKFKQVKEKESAL